MHHYKSWCNLYYNVLYYQCITLQHTDLFVHVSSFLATVEPHSHLSMAASQGLSSVDQEFSVVTLGVKGI